jgi:septum site-determining protein MinC
MAFALAPEPPLDEWLIDLDAAINRSPGFFVGRPAVLDLANTAFGRDEIALLIKELEKHEIRIMGIEGADPSALGPGLPPLLTSGRPASGNNGVAQSSSEASEKPAPKAKEQQPCSLLVENPVRSGQTVYFPDGDVVVLGSVGSGAEVVAGGSIHVYGALRGRAMAGSNGNPRARIFCARNEAELLAINGYYRIAEDMDANLRSRPVQAWLDGDAMVIAALE